MITKDEARSMSIIKARLTSKPDPRWKNPQKAQTLGFSRWWNSLIDNFRDQELLLKLYLNEHYRLVNPAETWMGMVDFEPEWLDLIEVVQQGVKTTGEDT